MKSGPPFADSHHRQMLGVKIVIRSPGNLGVIDLSVEVHGPTVDFANDVGGRVWRSIGIDE